VFNVCRFVMYETYISAAEESPSLSASSDYNLHCIWLLVQMDSLFHLLVPYILSDIDIIHAVMIYGLDHWRLAFWVDLVITC